MSTPVATVADALISFILSLLRDPAAVEEFDAAPKAMLANNGLEDACAADVQAVKPIIVDNPTVIIKPVGPPPPPDPPDEVVREIKSIINQFATIDNRTTIVDQSTNQNIWTNGGDVTQIFDQEAVVASGDESVAAGDDATVVDSDVDVTIGDVAIGNTTNDGSFNNTGVDPDAEEEALAADPAAVEPADDPADVAAIAGAAVETAVDQTLDASAAAQEAVQEPVAEVQVAEAPAADPLEADLTAADTYESEDAGSAVVDDAFIEEPIEEQ
jgi:hypothetical protein